MTLPLPQYNVPLNRSLNPSDYDLSIERFIYYTYVMAVDALYHLIGYFYLPLILSCRRTGGIDQIPWLSAEKVPAASVWKRPERVCG